MAHAKIIDSGGKRLLRQHPNLSQLLYCIEYMFFQFHGQLKGSLFRHSTIMTVGQAVLPCSLLDLLSNFLILRHVSPYIGIRSLLSLAATSKTYKIIVYNTPQVFQYVDLSRTGTLRGGAKEVSAFNERNVDRLFAQRCSTILSILEDRNILQDVRTLILDELYVPTTTIEDLLFDARYQIRLLSIRGVYQPEQHEMMRILRQLVKSSHPKETPKLRALYFFGRPSRVYEGLNFEVVMTGPEAAGITSGVSAQLGAGNHTVNGLDDFRKQLREDPYSDSPYGAPGMSDVLGSAWVASEWSETLEACAGLIAFDAVLCRHCLSEFRPRLGTVRLTGCKSCGTCPEGPAYPGVSPMDHLPLLSPPPLHSAKVEVAQRIETQDQQYPPLIVRCRTCLKDRWCEVCNVWWCESCYTIPKNKSATKGDPAASLSGPALNEDIKVHDGLCVSKCLVEVLLNGVGEGGMWG